MVDFNSKELIDYIMVLCERMGPKTYKQNGFFFYMKKNKKGEK